MSKVVSIEEGRKRQQEERIRQSHCTCKIAPAPTNPPMPEWTAAGWRCSLCKAIITGKHPHAEENAHGRDRER